MGMMEKTRVTSFLNWIIGVKIDDKKTWGKYDLNTMTAEKLYKEYGLEPNTIDFIGHAVALFTNEEYLAKPAIGLVKNVRQFLDS